MFSGRKSRIMGRNLLLNLATVIIDLFMMYNVFVKLRLEENPLVVFYFILFCVDINPDFIACK